MKLMAYVQQRINRAGKLTPGLSEVIERAVEISHDVAGLLCVPFRADILLAGVYLFFQPRQRVDLAVCAGVVSGLVAHQAIGIVQCFSGSHIRRRRGRRAGGYGKQCECRRAHQPFCVSFGHNTVNRSVDSL